MESGRECPYRPKISDRKADEEIKELMQLCWSEKPEDRPTFYDIKKRLLRLNKGRFVEQNH